MQTTTETYTSYKLCVFDPTRIEQQIRSNPTRAMAIHEILGNLIEQGCHPIAASRAARLSAEPARAACCMQQLKHSLYNFGALRVCDIATDIEQLLKTAPNDNGLETLFQALEFEMQLFFEQAQAWQGQQSEKYRPGADTSEPSLTQRLDKLLLLLADFNMQALDYYAQLQTELPEIIDADELREIDAALTSFDFERALQRLQACDLS